MIFRPLHIGVALLCVIEILQGAKANPSQTTVLILAIAALVCVLLDVVIWIRRPPP
jgi:hypothetical protein